MEEVNQPQFESMSQKRALVEKNFMIALCVMLCWVKYHIALEGGRNSMRKKKIIENHINF